MPGDISSEFKSFCLGLDIALSREHAKCTTQEQSEKRLDDAIIYALSGFELSDLERLELFLSQILASKSADELEVLWLSFKPTKVFFGGTRGLKGESAYHYIFKRAQNIITGEIARQRRNY